MTKFQTRRRLGRLVPLTIVLLVGVVTAVSSTASAADTPVNFRHDIVPLLEQHCIRCHSPGNEKGEISLATISDLSESGYLEAGNASESYLIELITPDDNGEAKMPQESPPMSAADIALIEEWINTGAEWPAEIVIEEQSKADSSWWSLQPLRKAEAGMTIDDFVRRTLAENQLTLNEPAARGTLIRRATFDLIGLPPTPDEVEQFVNDPDPQAYEKLIDRLLASPHYGERWGRHWLDVVRFGESNGFERNVIIDTLWPFRDYVIQSINDDKPFDQFIQEHLAGDVLAPDDPDVAVGSAFLVAGPYDDVGNQDAVQAAQIRANTLDEMISATGEAFLGLTIGCARCHNHKFDPITQRDYYGFYATFSGVRHGAVELATPEVRAERQNRLQPLTKRRQDLDREVKEIRAKVLERGRSRLADHEARWTRPPVDRTGTEDRFDPVLAKHVRLICEGRDGNPAVSSGFGIDEFEIWSTETEPRNVALEANGSRALGASRQIEDFPNAYGPQLAIDGKTGARFLSAGNSLTIELAEPTEIDRVVFSSAKGESTPEHRKFEFVADYRIEVSLDGQQWHVVSSGWDRQPVNRGAHLDIRLWRLEASEEEQKEFAERNRQLNEVNREIASIPALPSVWIGRRSAGDASGPFHIFLGGSPQKKGPEVVPASVTSLEQTVSPFELPAESDESTRRRKLAEWITDSNNALTLRVLANRIWHYHFGTGIVDTPSDFGYMGGRPSHPELLDFLAVQLREQGWRLKPMHRMIMLSEAYRQSSEFDAASARVDGDARLLWRFPPRRLSAEEIRDSILQIAGKLDRRMGGPGFRLYHFMQDNVCTYVPLDQHGPETYRRAVYHQNARASVVDLMTDFDQPDCAFSTPSRAETTTPLQALTMLNHSFTMDMANALSERLRSEVGDEPAVQVQWAYRLCYGRPPSDAESASCREFIAEHGLLAFCRVLLNTSEMIYVE
ncbi:DUF1553 domain-containing protein [Rubinisphaera margarita]|uniref:DUF1553 domain-containing protein n=1 Tax=Rubinisphaera margarita TaxID=2909586 RepID=UPI001EE810F5|nr:DUF1553 domain-containing protein [Rubinisphaera margarita]MCG6158299.1 DUF1553 domain-containing protein [Rubinisphaera margarita]